MTKVGSSFFMCRYCNKVKAHTEAGLIKHEAHCTANPNRNIRVYNHDHIGKDGYWKGDNYQKGGNK